jgi:adenylate cyclase
MTAKRGVSIQTFLLGLLIMEILVVVGITWWLWYQNGQQAVSEVETHLRDEISARIAQRIDHFLSLPDRINQINEDAYRMGRLDLTHIESMEEYVWRQLTAFESISYIDIGTEKDDFIGIERLADGTLQLELKSDSTDGNLHTFPLDEAGNRGPRKISPDFVTKVRPWYRAAIEADAPTWTEIYPFFSVPIRLGLTAVRPLRDEGGRTVGVLGCDLVLTHINHFLKDMDVGKSGKTYIMERDGSLVASSSDLEPVVTQGDAVLRIRAKDFGDSMIQASARFIEERFESYAGITKSEQAIFKFEGERILLQVSPLTHPLGIDWLAVVMIPEDDFMGSIHENTRTTLLLFFGLLFLATITILITTRRITASIGHVSREMNLIADFNVATLGQADSRLTEIRDMQSSMETMKSALRSFGKYVPSDVVRQLIRTRKDARLGVDYAEVTIFFSDVAGFTSIAESLSPDDLVAMMGEYLEGLSQLILESEGTVDKYIGDAIMAFWNAPEPVSDHPVRAVEAALQCTAKLEQMNAAWRKTGRPELKTRIGIHTGSALVGNFGSHRRMNYTVLGDSVNLAARLEGLGKIYGTQIIISEETHAQLKDHFLCRPLDAVIVKGRSNATRIYEVVAKASDASEADRSRTREYTRALDAYLARRFEDAEQRLNSYLQQRPGDAAATMLLDRCRRSRTRPPGPDWDGAIDLTEK